VTYVLIFINALSYYVVFYRMIPTDVFAMGGLIPSEWFGSMVPFAAHRPPEIICLLWSFFLHGGLLHLLSNMAFLYLFGPNLEARMGRWLFLLFYFSCAGAGASFQVLYDPSSTAPIIGASGAIAGLLGAYFVLFRDHFFQIDLGHVFSRSLVFPIYSLILFWFLLQIINGVSPLLLHAGDFEPVAYFAHIGGFMCGYILARRQKNQGSLSGKRKFRVFQGGKP
jgi:membrane associated rhomboid family serine protease